MKQLKCINHTPHVREYIMYYDEPIFSKIDGVLFLVSATLSAATYMLAEQACKNFIIYMLLFSPLILRFGITCFSVHQEILLVIQDHGIQMEAKSAIGTSLRKQFLSINDFEHLVITEGLINNQVIYYMAFLIENKDKMILPFMHVLPRYKPLLYIFQGIRAVLYGEAEPDELLIQP